MTKCIVCAVKTIAGKGNMHPESIAVGSALVVLRSVVSGLSPTMLETLCDEHSPPMLEVVDSPEAKDAFAEQEARIAARAGHGRN